MANLPRAAGAIDWYVMRAANDVVAARHQVRPGSYLTAYFDCPLSAIEDPSEIERARQRACSIVPPDELLGIARSTSPPTVEVTYIADVVEFDDWIADYADQPS